MILYNVTIKLDWSIHDAWLQWMETEHIPEVINTGCFTNANLARLLEIDDSEGPTYATQYFSGSRELYERYISVYAGIMRQKGFDKWGNRFAAFRSLMEVVHINVEKK
jgi:Domain of unknown function (DUF4286)